MATGYIIFPIAGCTLPDGSANNAFAELQKAQSTGADPKVHFIQALFDPDTDEHIMWDFQMPGNYASAPVVRLSWKANAVANDCVWGSRLAAITEADADTPNEKAFAAANTTTDTVNGVEARRLNQCIVTLTNADTVAANDWCILLVYRDANNGSDDLAVDAELIGVTLEYTTT